MKKIITILLAVLITGCSSAPSEKPEEITPEPTEEAEIITFETAAGYLKEGNYAKAIESFSFLISQDSGRAEYYIGRAEAYVKSGPDEETLNAAKADYEAAIALDDQLTDAYIGLADVMVQMDDIDAAAVILSEGIAKTSETIDAQPVEDQLAQIMQDAGFVQGGTVTEADGVELSDLHYYYRAGETNGIAGVTGMMHLYFLVTGPENVADVRASMYADTLPPNYVTIAEEQACGIDDYVVTKHTVPFYCTTYFQAVEDFAGMTVQVVLVALDENKNPVGHAVISMPCGE